MSSTIVRLELFRLWRRPSAQGDEPRIPWSVTRKPLIPPSNASRRHAIFFTGRCDRTETVVGTHRLISYGPGSLENPGYARTVGGTLSPDEGVLFLFSGTEKQMLD